MVRIRCLLFLQTVKTKKNGDKSMSSSYTYLEILRLNQAAMEKAQKKWDNVAKPLRGLGRLEDVIVRIAGIQGTENILLQKRAMLVFCADNGITRQGVTQTDSHVTAVVADNIADGKASISKMCRRCRTDVLAVDIGILDETYSEKLICRKIAYGTKDFSKEPAMSQEEAYSAIETGIALVKECREKGYRILGTGEMGIGNTTTGSAVAAALLGLPVETAVGRGAGLSDEGLKRKQTIIADAIDRYGLREKSAFEVLCHVGGFDIAGMAGAFIGGALFGVPVVIDGMISAVSALVAEKLCPGVVDFMLASHISREPCMEAILKELCLTPVIHADLALGEGSGAALLFPMLDMAEAVYGNDETFEKVNIKPYERYEE